MCDDPQTTGTPICVDAPNPIRTEDLLAEADWLHRLARAMLRDRERAHDVAQDTLVTALLQRPARVVDLRAWLQAIARRLASRALRTEQRRHAREQAVARTDIDDRDAQTTERLHLHRQLCDAVLELPEPYRTAVTLRFFDDLAPRAIAARLGTSPAIVRQRIHRAIAMLRAHFDQRAGGRHAWTQALLAASPATFATRAAVLLPLFLMKKYLVAALLLLLLSTWWLAADRLDTTANAQLAPSTVATVSTPAETATPRTEVVRAAATVPFVVRVVDAREHTIAGATVHRWQQGGEVENATTLADGCVAFTALPMAGGVLVQAPGFQAMHKQVGELRGEVVVQLGNGRVVAGQVFEDGVAVAAGMVLKLSVPTQLDALPDAPEAILALLSGPAHSLTTTTDGNGAFTFAGLAHNWAGELQLPPTHWLLRQAGQLVEGDSRLLVLAPDDRLRVETTRLPVVHGRVEWSDGGGPVARAFVHLTRITFADGSGRSMLTGLADAQGKFAIGLYPDAANQRERWLDPHRRSELTRIQVSTSHGTTTHQTLEAGGGPIDLRAEVLLRLDRGVEQRFRAVDAAGHPLAGARALHGDGSLSEPTGDDGLGTSRNSFGLSVGAEGRQVARIPNRQLGQGLGAEPHEVVLQNGNAIHVKVRTPTGAPAAANVVALTSQRAVVDGQGTNLRRWLGESRFDVVTEGFQFDRRGEARIVSLTPDVPCRLIVRDDFGGELATQEIVTPALGEQRVIDITLTAADHLVRGRVQDASGAPVALARVELRAKGVESGRGHRSVRSTADGAFRFAALNATGDLVLAAHRQGFAATERVVTLAELAHEITITLAAARRTTVRIVDEDGTPVPEPQLVVDTATDQQQVGPGEFVCLDLPPGEVTFACWVAGKRHELRHDTAKPLAELRVPRTARARFERPAGWQPSAGGRRLVAVAKRLDAAAEPLSLQLDDDARSVPQLLLPGRYRVELSEMWWNYEKKQSDTEPLGPTAEVELRANEVARVTFR